METANTSNFCYRPTPSGTSTIATAARRLIRVFVALVIASALAACSDGQTPSQLTGTPSTGASSSSASSASPKPAFATDQTSTAPADVLSVSVTPVAYSDQSLIAELHGGLSSGDGVEVPYIEWVQTSGPEADIVNKGKPITDVILPAVAEPTWVTFTLFAMTDGAQLASDSVSFRVLPTSEQLLEVNATGSSEAEQLTVSVSLRADASQATTFLYSTTDGTAQEGIDFEPISGDLTLGPDARSGTLTVNLLDFRDAPLTENIYFALNFHSEDGGRQRAYAIIHSPGDDPAPAKPTDQGPVTTPPEALPGGGRDQVTAIAVYGLPYAPGEMSVTNPCQQTFTIQQPADDCENSQGQFSHGVNNTLPFERASWTTAAEGIYQFAIGNPTEHTVSYDLYLFWGESSQHLSGSIPPGETVEVRDIEVTEEVLSYPPGSSSSASSSFSSTSSSSSSSSSLPNLEDYVSPCDSWEGGCASLQTSDNPYAGTNVYVDPDFQHNVHQYRTTAPASWDDALSQIGQTPTAIWIDKTEMILQGDQATARRSLADHLLLASQQQFNTAEPSAMAVQIVLRNETAMQVDETTQTEEIEARVTSYIDETLTPLRQLAEQFSNLRLIFVIEPNLVPELIKTNSTVSALPVLTPRQKSVGNRMVREAVQRLSDVATNNSYLYLGMGHAAWLPGSVGYIPSWLAANISPDENTNLRGFATNVGGYIPTEEALFIEEQRLAAFYQDQRYLDEYGYISSIRNAFAEAQMDNQYRFIIDTSRNGWGGPDRPTLAGGIQSRLDRRQHRDNWCNIKGAGLGEFPRVAPHSDLPYLDAFTWIKQPGYSDGNSETVGTEAASPDACDPINGDSLVDAPAGGMWFTSFFASLVENAWPPLLKEEPGTNGAPFSALFFEPSNHDIFDENAYVQLKGSIAEGAEVQQIQVFADGTLIELSETSVESSGSQFSINVDALNLPEQSVKLNSESVIDDTAYELRVLVRDTQETWFEGTVFYSTAYYASGTEAADAIYYTTVANWPIATGEGDDLVMPLDQDARPSQIDTGNGNDLIYATSGVFLAGAGNDTLYTSDSTSNRETSLQGGPGDDHYIYNPSASGDRRFIIAEDDTPEGGIDTLTLQNISPEDVENVYGNVISGYVEQLTITFINGDRLIFPLFAKGVLTPEPSTSIERILFDDDTEWEIDELLEQVLNPPS